MKPTDAQIIAAKFPHASRSTRAVNPVPNPRDWPGFRDYTGRCATCGEQFIGGKGHVQMRKCFECHSKELRTWTEKPEAAPVNPGGSGGKAKVRQRKAANKTEASFAEMLRALHPCARRIDREGITLRWPDGMTYTPDFVVWMGAGGVKLYETKGPFIRRSGLEKFRAARAHWPMLEMEMWQRDKNYLWEKIL